MRAFIVLMLMVFAVPAMAQEGKASGKRYYFIAADSLVGVKDAQGRVVIPAVHRNVEDRANGEVIEDEIIRFLMPARDSAREPHAAGVAYDRQGRLLYRPFAFDNGADEFSEGLARFVEGGKVGFVNRKGEKVIPARFDFATSFNYGIAGYCTGCTWQRDGEHQFVAGGKNGYINYSGKELQVMPQKQSFKDQKIDSVTCIAYPFTYSDTEQRILAFFQHQPLVSKAYFASQYSELDSSERRLYYEIVERPTGFFPYYHIKGFSLTQGYFSNDELLDADLNYYVTPDGKTAYVFEYGNDKKKTPFAKWLKQYVAEAREYLHQHPDAPYKF